MLMHEQFLLHLSMFLLFHAKGGGIVSASAGSLISGHDNRQQQQQKKNAKEFVTLIVHSSLFGGGGLQTIHHQQLCIQACDSPYWMRTARHMLVKYSFPGLERWLRG